MTGEWVERICVFIFFVGIIMMVIYIDIKNEPSLLRRLQHGISSKIARNDCNDMDAVSLFSFEYFF